MWTGIGMCSCGRLVGTLKGHKAKIRLLLVFGEYLLSVDEDRHVLLWPVGTLKGHKAKIRLLQVFGEYLLSVDEDRHVLLWPVRGAQRDAPRGEGEERKGKEGKAGSEEREENEEEVGGGREGTEGGGGVEKEEGKKPGGPDQGGFVLEPLGQFQLPEGFNPTGVIHPDTYLNKVLFASEDGRMHLWNVNSRKLLYEFKGWGVGITALVGSPALDTVAVGCSDGKVHVHNIRLDKPVVDFTHAAAGAVTSLAFNSAVGITALVGSPALDTVAVGCSDGKVHVHNIRLDRPVVDFTHAAAGAVTSLAFNSVVDFTHAAAGAVTSLAFNSDGPPMLAVGGMGGAISVWDLTNRRLHSIIPNAHVVLLFCCALLLSPPSHSSDGPPMLAVGGMGGAISVWDLTNRRLHSIIPDAHDGRVAALSFLVNEPLLLSAGADNSLKVLTAVSYRVIASMSLGSPPHQPPSALHHPRRPRRARGSPLLLRSAGADNSLKVPTAVASVTPPCLHAIIPGAHDGRVAALSFLVNEPVLLSAGADNSLKVLQERPSHSLSWPRQKLSYLLHRSGPTKPGAITGQLRKEDEKDDDEGGEDKALNGGLLCIVHATLTTLIQLSPLCRLSAPARCTPCPVSLCPASLFLFQEEKLKLSKVVCIDAAEVRERDWANVVTCHEGNPAAFVWELRNFVIGKLKLVPPGIEPSPATACAASMCGNFALVGTSAGHLHFPPAVGMNNLPHAPLLSCARRVCCEHVWELCPSRDVSGPSASLPPAVSTAPRGVPVEEAASNPSPRPLSPPPLSPTHQACAASMCGNFALVGTSAGHLHLFHLQSARHRVAYQTQKQQYSPAHGGMVTGAAIDSLNRHSISCCRDGHVKVRETVRAHAGRQQSGECGLPVKEAAVQPGAWRHGDWRQGDGHVKVRESTGRQQSRECGLPVREAAVQPGAWRHGDWRQGDGHVKVRESTGRQQSGECGLPVREAAVQPGAWRHGDWRQGDGHVKVRESTGRQQSGECGLPVKEAAVQSSAWRHGDWRQGDGHVKVRESTGRQQSGECGLPVREAAVQPGTWQHGDWRQGDGHVKVRESTGRQQSGECGLPVREAAVQPGAWRHGDWRQGDGHVKVRESTGRQQSGECGLPVREAAVQPGAWRHGDWRQGDGHVKVRESTGRQQSGECGLPVREAAVQPGTWQHGDWRQGDGHVKVWFLKSGRLRFDVNVGSPIVKMTFHHGNNLAAVACENFSTYIFASPPPSLPTVSCPSLYPPPSSTVSTTRPSSDRLQEFLSLHLCISFSPPCQHSLAPPFNPPPLSLSPPDLAAIACENFTTYIFDAEAGRLVRRFPGHEDRITAVEMSPDGRWLLTSAMDLTVRTWHVVSGRPLDAFQVPTAVVGLSMSPTSDLLATIHLNRRGIYLWANKAMYSGRDRRFEPTPCSALPPLLHPSHPFCPPLIPSAPLSSLLTPRIPAYPPLLPLRTRTSSRLPSRSLPCSHLCTVNHHPHLPFRIYPATPLPPQTPLRANKAMYSGIDDSNLLPAPLFLHCCTPLIPSAPSHPRLSTPSASQGEQGHVLWDRRLRPPPCSPLLHTSSHIPLSPVLPHSPHIFPTPPIPPPFSQGEQGHVFRDRRLGPSPGSPLLLTSHIPFLLCCHTLSHPSPPLPFSLRANKAMYSGIDDSDLLPAPLSPCLLPFIPLYRYPPLLPTPLRANKAMYSGIDDSDLLPAPLSLPAATTTDGTGTNSSVPAVQMPILIGPNEGAEGEEEDEEGRRVGGRGVGAGDVAVIAGEGGGRRGGVSGGEGEGGRGKGEGGTRAEHWTAEEAAREAREYWVNLVMLDVIKERNRPIQPPKKPEQAPFFLPSVPTFSGAIHFAPPQAAAAVAGSAEPAGSAGPAEPTGSTGAATAAAAADAAAGGSSGGSSGGALPGWGSEGDAEMEEGEEEEEEGEEGSEEGEEGGEEGEEGGEGAGEGGKKGGVLGKRRHGRVMRGGLEESEMDTELMRAIRRGAQGDPADYSQAMALLKAMSPSAVDLELRAIEIVDDSPSPADLHRVALLMSFLEGKLRGSCDFELLQAIHGSAISSFPQLRAKLPALRAALLAD
ncbi:unnamed protein product [Closterium sp. Naga37s-1]|nr:unnamed protein product [Closterium sp. Naga37s-1]